MARVLRKVEVLQLHQAAARVRAGLLHQGLAVEHDFAEYALVGVRPLDFHRTVEAHSAAIMALTDCINRVMGPPPSVRAVGSIGSKGRTA